MSMDYMSSESSAEESESTEGGTITLKRSVLKVKRLPWLRKKFRDAFHMIDVEYYNSHKKSRDKLKQRVHGGNSARLPPQDAPKFAVKSEYRTEDLEPQSTDEINSSFSSESSSPI